MARGRTFYQSTRIMLQEILESSSISSDKRRLAKPRRVLKVGVRTSTMASMFVASTIIFCFAVPTTVFGQANPEALRNMQDMRSFQEEASRELLSQIGITTPATEDNLVILSHRFNDDRFSSEIIGELLNNDTRSYDKFDINIDANFRDATGRLISSHSGYIDAEILRPGESSAFNVYLFGGEEEADASTYDLIINDERIVQGQSLDEEFEISNNDDDDNNDNDDDDNDDDDNDNDDDGPLERLGRLVN